MNEELHQSNKLLRRIKKVLDSLMNDPSTAAEIRLNELYDHLRRDAEIKAAIPDPIRMSQFLRAMHQQGIMKQVIPNYRVDTFTHEMYQWYFHREVKGRSPEADTNVLAGSIAKRVLHPVDLIGDIHGHADELEALLKKLGYTRTNGAYSHPTRSVVFLGDYIDRGPKIPETLAIVRGMVDAGAAMALMGNHEYNALCYHTPDGKGGYLRAHEDEKLEQHAATLEQFKGNEHEWAGYLDWFRTLPLWIETHAFRAVHACWDPNHINLLERELKSGFTKDVLERSTVKNTPLWTAVEETLKGKELDLPDGITFPDKSGKPRKEARIRWWEHPEGRTYHDHSVTQESLIPKDTIMDHRHAHGVYGAEEVPVFFGHYWLQVHPAILAPNVCCLDHSVAKEEGRLMAYRFDGERKLQFGKLVHVNRMTHA